MSTSKKRPREAETQPDASRMMDRSAVLPRPLFPSTKINQHEGGRGPRHFSSSSSTPKSSPSVLLMSRENPYLSEGMRPSGQRKTHRKLQFNEPGRFASEAEADRKAAKLASLSRSIEQRLGDDQVLSDAILAMAREATPDVEWWDEPFVASDSNFLISSKVFHLPPMPAGAPQPIPIVKPMMLTRIEQRKLRRHRRLEAQKEKREQIRLGLLPPEESKCNWLAS